MRIGATRVLLFTLGAGLLSACSPAEATSGPKPSTAQRDRDIAREQRALDKRRLQLENQVLADLRKLRQNWQASTGAAEPARDDDSATSELELLVFGGASHEVFLGCLCDEHRPDSVFNMVGEHGSDVAPASMRNKFAPYGSNYDDTSACNAAATHPPVVLASDGKSLGLLTSNPSLKRRISSASVADWLARMCST